MSDSGDRGPPNPGGSSARAAMAARFREVFEAKKASGLESTAAALETLQWFEALRRSQSTDGSSEEPADVPQWASSLHKSRTNGAARSSEDDADMPPVDVDDDVLVHEPPAVKAIRDAIAGARRGDHGWGAAIGKTYSLFSSADALRDTFGGDMPTDPRAARVRTRRARGSSASSSEPKKRRREEHNNHFMNKAGTSSSTGAFVEEEEEEEESKKAAKVDFFQDTPRPPTTVPRERFAEECYALIASAAESEGLRNGLRNALDALALELTARQGDDKCAAAWLATLLIVLAATARVHAVVAEEESSSSSATSAATTQTNNNGVHKESDGGSSSETTTSVLALDAEDVPLGAARHRAHASRAVFVSLGAASLEARETFRALAVECSPETRVSLAKHVLASRMLGAPRNGDDTVSPVVTGDHSEALHAARAIDALRDVDQETDRLLSQPHEALNDRLAEDDALVAEALRAWSPDEPFSPNPRTGRDAPRRAGTSLLSYPYLLDAASKARFLQAESRSTMRRAARDELRRTVESTGEYRAAPYFVVPVRRSHVIKDAKERMVKKAKDEDLRKQLKVIFHGEDGVDEGGVANEFLQLVARRLLGSSSGGDDGNGKSTTTESTTSAEEKNKGSSFFFFTADDESKALWFAHRRRRPRPCCGAEDDVKSASKKGSSGDGSPSAAQSTNDDGTQTNKSEAAQDNKGPNNSGEDGKTTTTPKADKAEKESEHSDSDEREDAELYELAGILLGVAVHNSVLVDAPFAKFLWRKLLDAAATPTLDDLADAAPAVARSLRAVLNAASKSTPENAENNNNGAASSLSDAKEEDAFPWGDALSWDVSFDEVDPATGQTSAATARLPWPSPSQLTSSSSEETTHGTTEAPPPRVTRETAPAYVAAYVSWWFRETPAFTAFRRGFDRVLSAQSSDVYPLLTPSDLELLVRGSPSLDFDALRKAARYEDGYDADSPTVRHFWRVVDELDMQRKLKLLKFVTGSDRAPIKGAPRIVISRSTATHQLPSSHTCFAHLILPDYDDYYTLRTKLLIAIAESSEGFGLR